MLKKITGFSAWFSQKTVKDAVTAYSGEAALYILISLFPFFMFLLTLLQYLPFTQAELMEMLERSLPHAVNTYLADILNELYSTSGTVLSVTIVLTLWTASRGILTVYRGLNAIYGIEETRNYFVIRFRSMIYTLLFSIMLVMLLGLYVFGNQIYHSIQEHFPAILQNRTALVVVSFRSTIGATVLIMIFLVMYNFMPNRRSRILSQLPGAVIAGIGWVGFSNLFSLYIDNMGVMTATYGSLTTAVLCIIWLYICMMIFFFGAEVNSVLELPGTKEAIQRIFPKKTRLPRKEEGVE
ncbi:MAG: YihY/virulence factor BrkB family protein [Lachnospiraceae bacterium]|nr:YihY/virulence factor BrkB family protein [Lachnospiraceae bacterium]